MANYANRVADRILAEKLAGKGAVLIEGAKWCGKTTTAEQIAKSVLYMGDKDEQKRNLDMADFKPSRLLEGLKPRLLDEWQIAPKLWDAVRFSVDHTPGMGHYILTGSTVPDERRAEIDGTRTKSPSFRMIVVADGDFAYRRDDGVIVCPIGCLRP